MKRIGVLIDSTSTFDLNELEKNDISIISNSVNDENGNIYIDDYTNEQKLKIGKEIQNNIKFKTSLINKEIIINKFNELLKKYNQIIFLCIGPGFSGQYNNAINAKKELNNNNIIVIHSNSTACQSEIILNWLIDYIKNNNDLQQDIMQKEIIKLSNHITTMFVTNDYRGFINTGRVPSIVAKTLKLTKTFPIICAEETNKRERFFRKWDQAIENIFEAIDKRFDKAPRNKDIKELYICQSLCDDTLINELKQKMAKHFDFDENEIKIRVTPLCILMTTSLNSFGIGILTNNNITKKKNIWKL